MSSAFGFGGLQLLLLIVVPSFGIVASAVYRIGEPDSISDRTPAIAILVGLVITSYSIHYTKLYELRPRILDRVVRLDEVQALPD